MGGFIYGLAVVLVIFEGIITKCEGTGGAGIAGCSECHLKLLPNELITEIVQDIGINERIDYLKDVIGKKLTPDPFTSNILQDSIILINNGNATEGEGFDVNYEHGIYFVRFDHFEILMSFFEKCGKQVRRIYINIDWDSMNESNQEKFVKNIFKTHAKHIEELQIKILNDEGFWEKMSNGGKDIKFPQVKKFQITGESKKKEFNLNFIFPNMTSFGLFGNVTDSDCLAEVTRLEELILHTKSIPELKIGEIFKKNNKIEKLSLSWVEEAQTMYSIATYLPWLKTLQVKYPGNDFLFQTDSQVHELRSVTHFNISFTETMQQIGIGIGNLSFNMPILKKLILNSVLTDCQVVYFVKKFEALDVVEFSAKENSQVVDCIGKLKHIKEYTIFLECNYEFTYQVNYLMHMFENLDKNPTLEKVKFENVYDSPKICYENKMKIANKIFRRGGKPTWTLSREQFGESLLNLTYERDPEYANFA